MNYFSNTSENFIKKLQRERTDYNHASQVRMQAKSLMQLSVGIYTEPERFVYELLQNAVDAFTDIEGDTLNILIKAEEDQFVFMHNGKAFDSKDVEGISDVGNGTNFHPHSLDSTNSRFTTRAGPFDDQINFLNSHRLSGLDSLFSSKAGSKRSALAGTFVADSAGAAPANRGTHRIGDRNDGVIKGSINVHLCRRHGALYFTCSSCTTR